MKLEMKLQVATADVVNLDVADWEEGTMGAET